MTAALPRLCILWLGMCVVDVATAQVAPSMFWRDTAPATCGGTLHGSYCWYYGALNQSCTTVCATHGGTHDATIDYAGSSGTDPNCLAVLDALSVPGTTYGICAMDAYGCAYAPSTTSRCRGTTTTTHAYANASFRRACACAN